MGGASWLASFIGLAADAIGPLLLLVFAVLFIVRGGRPRLGGLRLIGAALALWALTELLSWPFQNRMVYDTVYNMLGVWVGENYSSISRLIGTIIGAVSWGLGGAGILKLVTELAEER